MFADLKDSTQAISAVDAESAMVRMKPLISDMTTAVREHGGTTLEVRGDGILASFDSLDDHPLAACRAALAIRRKTRAGSPLSLPVRIGIHTGEVVVSPADDGSYRLIGATVHLASRLEQAAEPNTILLSEDVNRALAGGAELQPRGRFTFKGFDRPIETWELIDVQHRSRWDARALLGLTPYYGRTAERALLTSFIEQVKTGTGGVLCVTGDPGTGKSRFIHDALRSGSLDGCTVWLAESELPARHAPYAVARSIARKWLGLTDHNTQLECERRLAAIVQQITVPIIDHAPALKALLNLPLTDTAWPTFDLIDRKRRLLLSFMEICRLQTRYRPLFVIIDDAQWCDPESLDLLCEFARQAATMSAGLILLARPDAVSQMPDGLASSSFITLREFTDSETQEFLTQLLGVHSSLDGLKVRLGGLAGGLPFFLEEAVRYLARNLVLVGDPGNYSMAPEVSSINIPETVEALVSSRISSLSPDLWSVLSAAAVVGRAAPLSLIARICDRSVADLQSELEDLERQHIISVTHQNSDTVFEFRHEFFRQVAYNMILSSARLALHAKTLRAAEVLFDNRISDWIAFLAYHATLASLHADAARYCRIAAENAIVASSYSAASEFCEQAVRHLEMLPQTVENIQASIDVRLLLRVAAGATSDFQSWLQHLTKAIELAEQIGDTPRRLLALIHRTWALNFSSSAIDAIRAGETAVGLAQGHRIHSSEVLARFALAQAYYAHGGYTNAIETLAPAIAWLGEGRETDQFGTTGTTLVLCLMMQANAYAAMGRLPAAERELSRLEELANRTGRPYDQVALAYCRGVVWGSLERRDAAINALESGYETCRKHGLNLFLPLISASLAAGLVPTGNLSRARAVALVGLEVAEKLGHNVARSAAAGALAAIRLAEGNHREAIRLASEARSAAKAHGHRGVEIGATRMLAQAFRASSPADFERPMFLMREAIDLAETIQAVPSAAACGLILVDMLTKAGHHVEAATTCERLIQLAEQQGMLAHVARLRALLGDVAGPSDGQC